MIGLRHNGNIHINIYNENTEIVGIIQIRTHPFFHETNKIYILDAKFEELFNRTYYL